MSFRRGLVLGAPRSASSSPLEMFSFLSLPFSYPIDNSRPAKHDARASTAEGESGARRMVMVVFSGKGFYLANWPDLLVRLQVGLPDSGLLHAVPVYDEADIWPQADG